MELNQLKSAPGSRKNAKRVGRGIGCGNGKTCGRGHKGQSSRSGGSTHPSFEGGQMPLQRRIPKFGFKSPKALVTKGIPLGALQKLNVDKIDIAALRAANIINSAIERVKVYASGTLDKAVTLAAEIRVTAGARKAIEAAGGKVEA